MRRFIVILSLLSLVHAAHAGNGTTSASFLNVGSGTRPLALAGAYTALGDDTQSLFWNPAGLALLNRSEATLTYQDLGESIHQQGLSFGSPLKNKGRIGSTLITQSVRDIKGYDNGGLPTNEIKDDSAAFSLGYAQPVRDHWFMGANLKWIRQRLDSESAHAYAADVGFLHINGIQGLRWGGSARNLGSGLKFVSETESLPTEVRLGVSYAKNILG